MVNAPIENPFESPQSENGKLASPIGKIVYCTIMLAVPPCLCVVLVFAAWSISEIVGSGPMVLALQLSVIGLSPIPPLVWANLFVMKSLSIPSIAKYLLMLGEIIMVYFAWQQSLKAINGWS